MHLTQSKYTWQGIIRNFTMMFMQIQTCSYRGWRSRHVWDTRLFHPISWMKVTNINVLTLCSKNEPRQLFGHFRENFITAVVKVLQWPDLIRKDKNRHYQFTIPSGWSGPMRRLQWSSSACLTDFKVCLWDKYMPSNQECSHLYTFPSGSALPLHAYPDSWVQLHHWLALIQPLS